MPVLNESSKSIYVGGCKPSCVFNCFDYLDGDLYDSCHYYELTSGVLGYKPRNDGGVPTSDIPAIGRFGGFYVQEVTSGTSISIRKDGTSNGGKVMMVYNAGNIGRAVIVTGYRHDASGNLIFTYHDPTTKKEGEKAASNCTLYTVSPLYIDSPVSGSTDNPISGIIPMMM